jgi:hypothetical protein
LEFLGSPKNSPIEYREPFVRTKQLSRHVFPSDIGERNLPLFPTLADVDLENFEGSVVYADSEAVRQEKNDPLKDAQRLLELISEGVLPPTCFDHTTWGWRYNGEYSSPRVFAPFASSLEADMTCPQGVEDYFQFLVREGIIQDRRGNCSASSSTWVPARQGLSLDEHSRIMYVFERLREAGSITADMHEALKRRYPESLVDHSLHEAVDYLMRWTDDSAMLDEKPALAASGRPSLSQRGSSSATASKKRIRAPVAATVTASDDGPQGGASSSEDPREAGHSTRPSGPATSTGAGKTNKRRHNK